MMETFKKVNLAEGINDKREAEDYVLMARSDEVTIVEMHEPYEKCLNISYMDLQFPHLTSIENILKEIKEKMENEWGTENAICLNHLDEDMHSLRRLANENNIRFR